MRNFQLALVALLCSCGCMSQKAATADSSAPSPTPAAASAQQPTPVAHAQTPATPAASPTAPTAAPAAPTPDAPAEPAAAALKVGSPAPALTPAKWVKGEPVDKLEAGKVYVVEFWATWCGPCKQSIPHLTELAHKFKDITFIGQDVWEQDPTDVEPFVKEMGDKMDYHVAMDDAEHGKMDQAWMAAAGEDGIPTAFVVDKTGKIAWIGHPMQLEPVLTEIEAGTFDPEKAAAEAAKREALGQKLQEAVATNDPDKIMAAIDDIQKADPSLADQLLPMRFETYLKKKDTQHVTEIAKTLMSQHNDDAQMLNEIAWSMVDPENALPNPDLALSEKAALRANELSKGEVAGVLDTLAHVYDAEKKYDLAVTTETQAVAKNDDPQAKDDLDKSLAKFKTDAGQK